MFGQVTTSPLGQMSKAQRQNEQAARWASMFGRTLGEQAAHDDAYSAAQDERRLADRRFAAWQRRQAVR